MQPEPDEKEKLERLRRDIEAGWAQAEAGELVEFELEQFLEELNAAAKKK